MQKIHVDETKAVRLNDLVQLSADTSVPVADIIWFIRSRGRGEVESSIVQRCEQNPERNACWSSPSVVRITRPRTASCHSCEGSIASARRSLHLAATEKSNTPTLKTKHRVPGRAGEVVAPDGKQY
ncbi:hypothetical protein IV203_031266 [Nitzschia inconspicua]|uniref:Uncharacterized protein n=1 Tax=Nitzschia inconspicua TaxID=303405 RepID=A0A9K3LV21_9STRA|nr:hypothetical protein IV203_031266 [Nitzschia inconspicua]